MKTNYLLLILLSLITNACNFSFNTPEEYFDRTTLNTNKFSDFGYYYFKTIQEEKKGNQLFYYENNQQIVAQKYTDFVQKFTLPDINKDIEKIKNLKETDETKEMIQRSLDVFTFVKSVYETDYIKIAKMLDENQSEDNIQKAIEELGNKKDKILEEKMTKLKEVSLPYAQKNGIKVSEN